LIRSRIFYWIFPVETDLARIGSPRRALILCRIRSVEPNYLTTEEDKAVVLRAIRLARRVISQPAMAPYVVRETRPGIDIQDDNGLLNYIRESGQTSFHPVGTCRMGDDAMAVVDASLRVHGVSRLRVVDSSVMPTIPSSNANAASIMVGEKAADLILSALQDRPQAPMPAAAVDHAFADT
jgi:choline dehydrogenase-like flavoprotein